MRGKQNSDKEVKKTSHSKQSDSKVTKRQSRIKTSLEHANKEPGIMTEKQTKVKASPSRKRARVDNDLQQAPELAAKKAKTQQKSAVVNEENNSNQSPSFFKPKSKQREKLKASETVTRGIVQIPSDSDLKALVGMPASNEGKKVQDQQERIAKLIVSIEKEGEEQKIILNT